MKYKLILVLSVLILLPLVLGSSTFFDNPDDFFIMSDVVPTPVVTPVGGGGGRAILPECVNDSGCELGEFCFENKCYIYECEIDSDCNDTKTCWINRCVKLFDMVIEDVSSPIYPGEFFNFTYYLKGVAAIHGDVIVKFWLVQNDTIVTEGFDTIYMADFEEKRITSELFLPSVISPGVYNFYAEVEYDSYYARAGRIIEVEVISEEEVEPGILTGQVVGPIGEGVRGNILSVLITTAIFILGIIIWWERRKIKRALIREKKWFKRNRVSIFTGLFFIILIGMIYYLGESGIISLPSLGESFLNLFRGVWTLFKVILPTLVIIFILALLVIFYRRLRKSPKFKKFFLGISKYIKLKKHEIKLSRQNKRRQSALERKEEWSLERQRKNQELLNKKEESEIEASRLKVESANSLRGEKIKEREAEKKAIERKRKMLKVKSFFFNFIRNFRRKRHKNKLLRQRKRREWELKKETKEALERKQREEETLIKEKERKKEISRLKKENMNSLRDKKIKEREAEKKTLERKKRMLKLKNSFFGFIRNFKKKMHKNKLLRQERRREEKRKERESQALKKEKERGKKILKIAQNKKRKEMEEIERWKKKKMLEERGPNFLIILLKNIRDRMVQAKLKRIEKNKKDLLKSTEVKSEQYKRDILKARKEVKEEKQGFLSRFFQKMKERREKVRLKKIERDEKRLSELSQRKKKEYMKEILNAKKKKSKEEKQGFLSRFFQKMKERREKARLKKIERDRVDLLKSTETKNKEYEKDLHSIRKNYIEPKRRKPWFGFLRKFLKKKSNLTFSEVENPPIREKPPVAERTSVVQGLVMKRPPVVENTPVKKLPEEEDEIEKYTLGYSKKSSKIMFNSIFPIKKKTSMEEDVLEKNEINQSEEKGPQKDKLEKSRFGIFKKSKRDNENKKILDKIKELGDREY